MDLTERHLGPATLVEISGRLRLEDGVEDFRRLLKQLVAEGRTRIVLNLAACHYLDSAGIGELVTALVRVRNAGGTLILVSLNDRVRELLRITRLLDVFVVAADEHAAIEAAQAS